MTAPVRVLVCINSCDSRSLVCVIWMPALLKTVATPGSVGMVGLTIAKVLEVTAVVSAEVATVTA
jgi:hypothetical protein